MTTVRGSSLSNRAMAVEPFHVMRLLARARELEAAGRRVIHMEVGEPDFPTPEPIVEAGHAALAAGKTKYTPARGLPELRATIASYYESRYGLAVDAERILITPGASGALQLLLTALIDPGDGVLLPDPGYPCNRHLVRMLGGVPHAVPVGPETNYQLVAEHLEPVYAPDVRAVMVASPANPTGTLLNAEQTVRLYRAAQERGLTLIVDEIYQGLVYGEADHTALAAGSAGLFVVNSFSKYFGMTGWRLGWVVAPEGWADVLERLAQNLYLAAPTVSQYAALAAFDADTQAILEARRLEFQRRRDFLLPALHELGFQFLATPEGAFYLYAGCDEVAGDSETLAHRLLEEDAVAVTPGIDFGTNQARRYLRFAYTTDLRALEAGLSRLKAFLTRNPVATGRAGRGHIRE
jgi:aspartate/methionine/tyrosine aminotransferase